MYNSLHCGLPQGSHYGRNAIKVNLLLDNTSVCHKFL